MTFPSARLRLGARFIVCVCTFFTLLPLEEVAVADTITFSDNNDFVSATYTGTSITSNGGSIVGLPSCVGLTGSCTITINPPPTTFSAGSYANYDIFSSDELPNSIADTLTMSAPVGVQNLVLTFTSDFNEVVLPAIPGAKGALSSSTPTVLNNFSFTTGQFGSIPVVVQFQRNENDLVAPEPAALILSGGGLVGLGLWRRRRRISQ